jgi:hypothetical protein
MGLEDTASQDRSNESTLERIERDHRQIASFCLREEKWSLAGSWGELTAFMVPMEMIRNPERRGSHLVAVTDLLEEGGSG